MSRKRSGARRRTGRQRAGPAAALAFALWGLTGVAGASADDPAARALAVFAATAFQPETAPSGTPAMVRKWRQPVRIAVSGLADAATQRAVADQAALLSRLTGHDVALAGPGATANVMVRVAAIYALRGDGVAGDCAVEVTVRRGEILSGTVILPADDRARFRHCLAEELAQLLGLLGDGPSGGPTEGLSLFDDGARASELQPADRAALCLLYLPSIEPGMAVAEAIANVRRALAAGPGQVCLDR